jgi:hypothetical protein
MIFSETAAHFSGSCLLYTACPAFNSVQPVILSEPSGLPLQRVERLPAFAILVARASATRRLLAVRDLI